MFKIVVCSCGKSLRAYEGMPEIRCPACRRAHRLEHEPVVVKVPPVGPANGEPNRVRTGSESHATGSEMVVFGFDPPPPCVPKAPLGYKAIVVSSETTAPTAKPIEPDRSERRYRRESWDPNVDLDGDWPNIERRLRRDHWVLETAWYECLAYPARGLGLIAILGLVLTIATVGLLQVLRDDAPGGWFFHLLGCAALTYACGFLACAITAGARGRVARLSWPGANMKLLLESLLAGLLSFLAGPIIPAAIGVYFWLNAGEMALIDVLILLELASVSVGYWLLVFVSLLLSEKWSALQPAKVIEQARKLGAGRTFAALGVMLAIFYVHAWLALIGIENHHSVSHFLLLLICWSSLLFWMVFLMRWLGVSVHYLREHSARST